MKIEKIDDFRWRLPKEGGMRVEGKIYADKDMLEKVQADQSPQQVANVAHLPGILKYSLAMPDIHWGYGFPIGGVAAFDLEGGVISPGGVGYDINCGVRLVRTELKRKDIEKRLRELVGVLFQSIPTGLGSKSEMKLSLAEERKVLIEGARWAVSSGFGSSEDLEYIEEGGAMPGADPDLLSDRALERGRPQLGTLGSGNHFVEVGWVEEVFNDELAQVLGLFPGQVSVLIHTGSRGLGYQVCDDYIKVMIQASRKYGIELPDKQLCCAPLGSEEASSYIAAMICAVNYAFANRQMITHWLREAFEKFFNLSPGDLRMNIVYDVCHNIAKFETHTVDGKERKVCVHRKGATRAFGPGRKEVPARYRSLGQPVLIPGDMGRCSYVLMGTQKAMEETFGSTCHGAGRVMSRKQAMRTARGRSISRELEDRGIYIRAAGKETLAEEMPEAYKDVSQVVEVVHNAEISRKVARLRPLAVIKG
ncbi:MAG: RtcB family protein [Deltaproteobacteria bacterium]|nr:MAG: RtcB family protein [Deltaproteobacteria bacterium]